MSSRSLYFGLFIAAGLNLSFWGGPLQAESLRSPASSSNDCHKISRGLMESQKDISCNLETSDYGRKAKTNVQISTIYEVNDKGEKVKKGIEARTITEANCDNCNVNTGSKVSTLVYGLEDLKDFNNVQNKILAEVNKNEDEVLDELKKKIALEKAIENCVRNRDGERLDKEERFECRVDRLADMDEEEAEKYFNKYLKSEIQEKALSSNPEEREMALEALEKVEDSAYSDSLLAQIDTMRKASQTMSMVEQDYANAKQSLMKAQSLPEGHQYKKVFEQQASQYMKRAETTLNSQKMNALNGSLNSTSSSTSDINLYFQKIESNLNQSISSDPQLLALKANGAALPKGTGNASNANNSVRQQRGGAQIPGGLLTGMPQISGNPPTNSSFGQMPNANNLGRGTIMQNRVPAPIANQAIQQFPQQVQPMPSPIQGQMYNQFMPMGNQFQNSPGSNNAPSTLPML